MAALPEQERVLCARVFRHLVTPSGTKIAHSVADLAEYAGIDAARMSAMLNKVSGSAMRILAPVALPGDAGEVRYEIYHDSLAQAVLDWRRRFLEEQEREAATEAAERQRLELERERRSARRLRWLVATLAVAVVLALVATGFAWDQKRKAEASEAKAQASEKNAQEKEEETRRSKEEKEQALAQARTLTATLEDLRDEMKAASEQLDQNDLERLQAEKRLESLDQTLGELNSVLGSTDGGGIAGTVKGLQEERDDALSRAQRAEDDQAAAEARAGKAEEDLATAGSGLTAARGEIAQLKRRLSALEAVPLRGLRRLPGRAGELV